MISKNQHENSDSVAKAKTAGLLKRAGGVLAFDRFDELVPRPFTDQSGYAFPFLVERAEGYWVIDSMDRSFVDWTSGKGTSILGYNRPELKTAIERQMNSGPVLPMIHSLEIQVAELLVEMMPCAERVAFVKSDFVAMETALQIARRMTERATVLCCGDDEFVARITSLQHIGIQVETFLLSDMSGLEKLTRQHANDIAAIVMQPVAIEMPREGILEGVRKLSTEHDCQLIFDETWTAFRLASGGAQDFYGVVPDMACIGSGIANGMPISAVVGLSDSMQHFSDTCNDFVFRVDSFTLAVAKRVLTFLKLQPIYDHLESVGAALRERLRSLSQEMGVRCNLIGPNVRMAFEFPDCGELDQAEVRKLFLRECMKGGILTAGLIYPNFAHDERAIEMTMSAFASALKTVGSAIASGNIDLQPSEVQSDHNGYLESLDHEYEALKVCGWLLLRDGPADAIEVVSTTGHSVIARIRERADIKTAYPDVENAENAGYVAILPDDQFRQSDHYEFTIRGKRDGETVFECLVVKQIEGQPDSKGPYSTNDKAVYI